jgi:acetyltransferase-like isoleucine patch superfamily enzyme
MNAVERAAAMVVGRVETRMQQIRSRLRIESCMSRGLTIGKKVSIHWGAYIDDDYSYLISIGDNCYLDDGVRLVAHDAGVVRFTDGCIRLGRVDIRDNCYIGPNCIILPGVTIGPNVYVMAGSLVNRDIPPNSCVAGVPARFYSTFDEMIEYHRKQGREGPVFQYDEVSQRPGKELREKVKAAVRDRDSYAVGFKGRRVALISSDKR